MSVPIRALVPRDSADAFALYRTLTDRVPMPDRAAAQRAFETILDHPGTTVFGAEAADRIRAMATLHILPNMTYGARPYALIENVVSDPAHRGAGLARAVMSHAIDTAWAANAYKIMLLTGRYTGARGFYEKLGFTGEEKHAMTLRRVPVRSP